MPKTLTSDLPPEHRAALKAYAQRNGRFWKRNLLLAWSTGRDADEPDGPLLREIRNRYGPALLQGLSLSDASPSRASPKSPRPSQPLAARFRRRTPARALRCQSASRPAENRAGSMRPTMRPRSAAEPSSDRMSTIPRFIGASSIPSPPNPRSGDSRRSPERRARVEPSASRPCEPLRRPAVEALLSEEVLKAERRRP